MSNFTTHPPHYHDIQKDKLNEKDDYLMNTVNYTGWYLSFLIGNKKI